jgi:hypothetical protein
MNGNRYSLWPHVSHPNNQINTDTLDLTHRKSAMEGGGFVSRLKP